MSFNLQTPQDDEQSLIDEFGELRPDVRQRLSGALPVAVPPLAPHSAGRMLPNGVFAPRESAPTPRVVPKRAIGVGAAVVGLVLVALGGFFWVAGADKANALLAVMTPVPSPTAAPSTATATNPLVLTPTPVPAVASPTPDTAVVAAYNAAVEAFNRGDSGACSTNMQMVVAKNPAFGNNAAAYLFVCYQALADQQATTKTTLTLAEGTYNRALALYDANNVVLTAQFARSPALVPPAYPNLASWTAALVESRAAARNFATGYAALNTGDFEAAATAFTTVYKKSPLYLRGKGDDGDLAVRRQLVQAQFSLAQQRCTAHNSAGALAANTAARNVANDGSGDISAATLEALDRQKETIDKTTCA